MAEKIQILPNTPKPQPQPEQTATPKPSIPENPPGQTATSENTGTATQQPASGQPPTSQPAAQAPAPASGGSTQTNATPPA